MSDIGPLINRNIRVGGHRTSIRLEGSMWEAVDEICRKEDLTRDEFFTRIEARLRSLTATTAEQKRNKRNRPDHVTLSSAVRVFLCSYYRFRASEAGHRHAGHGRGDPFSGTPLDIEPQEESATVVAVRGATQLETDIIPRRQIGKSI
jgi:predicted DNA-binding ribbon-helix-helix protein